MADEKKYSSVQLDGAVHGLPTGSAASLSASDGYTLIRIGDDVQVWHSPTKTKPRLIGEFPWARVRLAVPA